MRKLSVFIRSLLIAGWLIVAIPGSTVVAESNTTVTMEGPLEVVPGSSFAVRIAVDQITDFNAASYDITYDVRVLMLESVSQGKIGTETISPDYWNQKSEGRYVIVHNISGLNGVSGSGYFAELHFYVLGKTGDTSRIDFLDGMLGNTQAQEIPSYWTGTSVTVVNSVSSSSSGTASTPSSDTTAGSSTATPLPDVTDSPAETPVPGGNETVQDTSSPSSTAADTPDQSDTTDASTMTDETSAENEGEKSPNRFFAWFGEQNWALIGGISGGSAAVIGFCIYVWKRRRYWIM